MGCRINQLLLGENRADALLEFRLIAFRLRALRVCHFVDGRQYKLDVRFQHVCLFTFQKIIYQFCLDASAHYFLAGVGLHMHIHFFREYGIQPLVLQFADFGQQHADSRRLLDVQIVEYGLHVFTQ